MQAKRTTGLRTAANDYVTIVAQASAKVKGFKQLYKEMERAISVSGKSKSTLTNYGRQLAHLALHYNCLPTELDNEQVLDNEHLVKSKGHVQQPSSSSPYMVCAMPANCVDSVTSSSACRRLNVLINCRLFSASRK